MVTHFHLLCLPCCFFYPPPPTPPGVRSSGKGIKSSLSGGSYGACTGSCLEETRRESQFGITLGYGQALPPEPTVTLCDGKNEMQSFYWIFLPSPCDRAYGGEGMACCWEGQDPLKAQPSVIHSAACLTMSVAISPTAILLVGKSMNEWV